LRVALLAGGRSSERDVSPDSRVSLLERLAKAGERLSGFLSGVAAPGKETWR
jgi:D-alanine-D-alanine ligase-like ATP-grasp enzyme